MSKSQISNNRWSNHFRSAAVTLLSMCIFNIGMVIWWAAKLDAITLNAVTKAELAIRDERIKYAIDAISANKTELQRTDDKIERLNQLISNNQPR